MQAEREYYLGLDIGTDSVGYAVTDANYGLLKFKGEPMWGTHLFEGANNAADRRIHRTNRRRIDRRQQRVALMEELFAGEVCKIDPNFFRRRHASALCGDDSEYGVHIFEGIGMTDEEYHKRYPTIHHLILELMNSNEMHDVRLVYMACAWLVAHRGHFLFDIAPDQIGNLLDFGIVYDDFKEFFVSQDYALPWDGSVPAGDILEILQKDEGVRRKQGDFKEKIYHNSKIPKDPTEEFPFNAEGIVTLLSGGSVKLQALYHNDAYGDLGSVSMQMGDEEFDHAVSELETDGDLLIKLRELFSCARLISTMSRGNQDGTPCISAAKVDIYETHKRDLHTLKRIVRSYSPEWYDDIFRNAGESNYVAYSKNTKSCPKPQKVKFVGKELFSEYLQKKLKNLNVCDEDRPAYEDMMTRLESRSFLPKQSDTDNRIIPQQLYRYELAEILCKAEQYLPMLLQKDADGLTISDKILSIFDFRIPYYVGPLAKSKNGVAWIERKQDGRILPWNFEKMVDLDASEREFINRMTNRCTYLPGEDVLPENSLLYEKFKVLNELNNLRIDGEEISVSGKQSLFCDLFMKEKRITVKRIREHLCQRGYITKDAELSGLDVTVKSSLRSYQIFHNMMQLGMLSEKDVEAIILHRTYTEDDRRMRRWLKKEFPNLSEGNVKYILRQKMKGFGRLSERLLNGIYGTERGSDGEAYTIIESMWQTNRNLMQLLSEKYTYAEQIEDYSREYYSDHPQKLTDRLSEMYVPNGVKRPIFRTLDIVSDVVKATGAPPKKIFVEMARGGTQDQKGKRTQSRKDQLLDLYKRMKTEDAKQFMQKLEEMGASADNRLQDRNLFLYYLQMGKCMYTGEPIELSRLGDGSYNREHIYPQAQVKDDSILNNLVLVKSEANGAKKDTYPVAPEIQARMRPFWLLLKENGLMTDEKYRRLTRTTSFTPDEKMGFINRQLVETRQSTKAVATLLKEKFPDAEIVYVKAGLVSEFRQEFELLKCRSVNDLHHAKDAYLNVVVGNVYHERFSKQWFRLEEHYNVQAKKLFTTVHSHGQKVYWNGTADLARVKKTAAKNAVYLTRYAFCRKGGLFDQQPLKKADKLIPLKAGLPTEKYGGYNKSTATGYVLARFICKKKREVMLVPVELMYYDRMMADPEFMQTKVTETLESIVGENPKDMEVLLGGRMLKINTVFSLDGTRMTLAGKSGGGRQVLLSPLTPLVLSTEWNGYIKTMESFQNKRKMLRNLQPDEKHDGITRDKNMALYRLLTDKMNAWPFTNYPGNQGKTLSEGTTRFEKADLVDQIDCLMNIVLLMGGGATGVDLTVCGGSKNGGTKVVNAKLSNWKKTYQDVRIIDESASGLFSKTSGNLLELL